MSEETNDVYSDKFESKMDDLFRSTYQTSKRKRAWRPWSGIDMGRGMMPPMAASDARRETNDQQ